MLDVLLCQARPWIPGEYRDDVVGVADLGRQAAGAAGHYGGQMAQRVGGGERVAFDVDGSGLDIDLDFPEVCPRSSRSSLLVIVSRVFLRELVVGTPNRRIRRWLHGSLYLVQNTSWQSLPWSSTLR